MQSSKQFLTRLALVGAGALLLANSAMAGVPTVKGCQAALGKFAKGYEASVAKAVAACADAVQKTIDGGDPVDLASELDLTCNGKFTKMGEARAKNLLKCQESTACDANTLHQLGHLVGGTGGSSNAPGSIVVDFVCNYVLERAASVGIQRVYSANPKASSQINAAGSIAAGSTATFFNAQPEESTHACSLTTSTTSVVTALGTIPLAIPGILQFNVFADSANADWVLLTGSPAKGIPAVTLLGNNVCVATAGVEGVCDCSGAAPSWNEDITLCRDSDTVDGDECPTQTSVLDNSAGTTANSPLWVDYGTDQTGIGDCNGTLAVSFKIVAPGDVGLDGTACTPDDDAAPLPAASVPFTTATSTGTIMDANDTDGATLSGTRTGTTIASCTPLLASSLSGLRIVATAPTMDGNLTGDAILAISLGCS